MACMKLGSKSESFHLEGESWHCSTGLPSDITVEVGETAFYLHKFPLLSRSKFLEDHIRQNTGESEKKSVLELHDIPGGAKTFLLVAKFFYGVKIELTALNTVGLRCAAEYLQMNEDHGEGNLIAQTETFLSEIFGNWADSLKALETCEEVLPLAEELHIISRCIDSLAAKACADPVALTRPISGSHIQSPEGPVFWNGLNGSSRQHPAGEDWWYEDVSLLGLPLFKRLIVAVGGNGMKPERVTGAVIHYAKKHLPLLSRQSNGSNHGSSVSASSDSDQKNLLEAISELLPEQKGVTPSKFLLRLLRTALLFQASFTCREHLEKRIGAQLDQAALEDLLIPNVGQSAETLYDIDCVQRVLDHFMLIGQDDHPPSSYLADEGQLMGESQASTPMTMVANLIDNYLAEVAPDVNLKLPKFQSLAAVIPDYARSLDDGLYRAIDIYLKAHPWLVDSEREQVCRLMNCQKLSLEASTHAAQNERLPLRVIVQVLFFEQLRLRTSIAGWLFVSDSMDNSQNVSGNLALTRNEMHVQPGTTQNHVMAVDDMKERVSDLEKECLSMKHEIEKLVKTRGSWNVLFRRIGFNRSRSKTDDLKSLKDKHLRESPISSSLLRNGIAVHTGEMAE